MDESTLARLYSAIPFVNSTPLIDGLVLLFITVLATLGLLKGMLSPLASPPTRWRDYFVPFELFMVLVVLLGAILSSYVASSAEATES